MIVVTIIETSNKAKGKYDEEVQKLKDNGIIKLTREDAQLISKIIETLAGEKNLTISHAQSILSNASMFLPMIIKV